MHRAAVFTNARTTRLHLLPSFAALGVLAALPTFAADSPGVKTSAPQTSGDRLAARANFDLPVQPLGTALKQFADQAGIQILFEDEVVGGLRAPAIKAHESAKQVLESLLSHTGLEYVARGQTVAVRRKSGTRSADYHSTSWNTRPGTLQLAQSDSPAPLGAGSSAAESPATDTEGPENKPVLAEVVVTAQKREQNIQDVGISITALSGAQLTRLGIRDTDALSSMTPGLFVSSLGSQGVSTFTLRGVSQNDFADQNEAPVAVYFDGAYNSFIGGVGASMFDVERVEVLRGPQGTLFGRNATGGLVHVISRKPSRDFEAYADVNLGQRNLREFEGAIGGALSDTFLVRLSAITRKNEGYINAPTVGTLQGTDDVSGRLQFQWLPTDSFNVLLNLHGSHDDVDGSSGYQAVRVVSINGLVSLASSQAQYVAFCNAQFGPNTPAPLIITATSACSGAELSGNPYWALVDNPGVMKRNTFGATATATVNLTSSLSFVSITDYLKLKRDSGSDTDGTTFRMFNFSSDADNDQYSQELRAQGQNERLNWTAGLFYLHINHDIRTGIDAVPDANTLANANPDTLFPFLTDNSVRQYTTSYAVFGQGELKLTDRVSLVAGARWNDDKKRLEMFTSCGGDIFNFTCGIVAGPDTVQRSGFNSITTPGLNRESNGDWSGKLELDLRPKDGLLLFASVNRGQKGGGFNASAIASITPALAPYRPEVLTSYETGFKATLLGGSTRFNSSVFYYDYSDYQAFTLTGLTPTIFNTDATVKGGEVELQSSPLNGLDFAFGAAYLDAMAKNVPLNLLGGRNLGDQHMPQSPKWSLNGLIRYGWDVPGGRVSLQADGRYVGKRYFNTVNHPALVDDGYTILDARVSYADAGGHWELAFWGRNLTDETYSPMGFDLSGTNGVVVRAISPPRWYGGSFSYKW